MAGEMVLIVDDDPEVSGMLSQMLEDERYHTVSAGNGQLALNMARAEKPDLILLDIGLPDMDGYEVCQEMRLFTSVPILFLSCKSQHVDKIVGLRVGGDDYITKPFHLGELLARIKAHLRRSRMLHSNPSDAQILRFPGLEIDLASYEIRGAASTSSLSTKEFQLLSILARNPNRVFHADHLFDLIWGLEGLGDTRTVAVHINTLRKKIEPDPSRPKFILTIRGAGYKFNAPKSI